MKKLTPLELCTMPKPPDGIVIATEKDVSLFAPRVESGGPVRIASVTRGAGILVVADESMPPGSFALRDELARQAAIFGTANCSTADFFGIDREDPKKLAGYRYEESSPLADIRKSFAEIERQSEAYERARGEMATAAKHFDRLLNQYLFGDELTSSLAGEELRRLNQPREPQ